MQKTYKGAIIGCGLIAHFHARAYQDVESTELAYVCDRTAVEAKRFAEKYNVSKYTTDYKEILQDPEIDFVEILTPHSSHFEIAKDCILSGKAVNLQKVPTVTVDEFNKLKDLVKENNATLRVFENFRYFEPYQFAKKLIDEGEIGKIKIVNIHKFGGLEHVTDSLKDGSNKEKASAYVWRIKESENYQHPTIFDDGYHKHSLIEFFLGEPITQVRGWCDYETVLPGVKLDSRFDIQYFTKRKKLGTFQSINIEIKIENKFYPCDEVIEIIGQEGMIRIYGGHGQLFTDVHESPIKQGVYWIRDGDKWHSNTDLEKNITKSFSRGLEKFIAELAGEKDKTFTLEDAGNSLKIGIGIVESLRNDNKLVNVSEIDN